MFNRVFMEAMFQAACELTLTSAICGYAGAYLANLHVSKPAKQSLNALTAQKLWDESNPQIHIALSQHDATNPTSNLLDGEKD